MDMSIRGLGVAEQLGARRLRITLRLSIALAAVLIVAGFTASGAWADYPLVDKYFQATTVHAADRPFDIPIDSMMIHDTEGSWQSAVDVFTGPTVSAAQYLVSGQVNSSDPEVTQFAHDKDWVQSVNN